MTEEDYNELINHLIKELQEYWATDMIRQIRELESINMIEKKPETADKKSNRETVSEYYSRPMSCREIYYAAVDILETYLIAVPAMLEKLKKGLELEELSQIVWKNESSRSVDIEGTANIISAVKPLTSEKQAEIKELIHALKNAEGGEYA